ncbi:hypothetical protein [Streptomyces hainanensis]|uniref:Uncharacterized protein n=1 Tax=Streptomyces hainanensis TaxID=402648 RepID=A0A4R4TBM4_9ACTN|nr:hypothetical protein [Streptomyces hainanensis]TDC74627.1 hypothetical protein E1283_15115 [Streptomyces hainanensis]
MSDSWFLLIPVAALVVVVLGPAAVLKLQKVLLGRIEFRSAPAPGAAAPNEFQQSSQESREEFVRRHWQRPGVVADGVTLVDLYDRIRALEERVNKAEQHSASPPLPD